MTISALVQQYRDYLLIRKWTEHDDGTPFVWLDPNSPNGAKNYYRLADAYSLEQSRDRPGISPNRPKPHKH